MKEPDIARWDLIRGMLIFQAKLAIDAIRDLFLSPVSIVCGLADILIGNPLSKSYFHKLMSLGQKTDTWLNLFGKHNKDATKFNFTIKQKTTADMNVDELFKHVETLIKEQHGKGGLTTSTKATIDRYLNKIVEKKSSRDK
jgi:hypothetical protein